MAASKDDMTYLEFFRNTFSDSGMSLLPFDYQMRLATERELPSLLNVPTGAGKTNAVLGAWLWRRVNAPESVGRRLIYCLPMRTLVEQTRDVAKAAVRRLEENCPEMIGRFSVHVLYGGDVSEDWDIYPEREQIIIGTQDMLLSRALNRGYAMNRFRWAFHFGLLNNDCLWVFDEVQLFGDGLATTTQLQAMREKFQTFGTAKSIWMSATLDREWLKTIDFAQQVNVLRTHSLSEIDRKSDVLKRRLESNKALQKADTRCRLPNGLSDFVIEKHESGTQTLVVVNTVRRAQEVFAEINKYYGRVETEARKSGEPRLFGYEVKKPDIRLFHSRFRPAERSEWQSILTEKNADRIIVATQVVEAGVDLSSKLLITDLAPFASMVQRFGRCNRNGEHDHAEVLWVDLPLTEKDRGKAYSEKNLVAIEDKKLAELVRPYELESLRNANAILESIDSVSPVALEALDYSEPFVPDHVLRRRDLVDLFDTTADLSGFDLDVSRFVRGGSMRDVSVYWRADVEETISVVKETKKAPRELQKLLMPNRNEICSVPIYEAKGFLKRKSAWTFNPLRGNWEKADTNNLRPGMILLVDSKSGGYDLETGWNPKSKRGVETASLEPAAQTNDSVNESYNDDNLSSYFRYTQTLKAHSLETREAVEKILLALDDDELAAYSDEIISAAHHHDLGKAHEVFQKTLHGDDDDSTDVLAKSKKGGRHSRKKFRHELASALALLENGRSDLEVYLAAAHHGKVRLTIRALPDEDRPKDHEGNPQNDRKFARGIWDDDTLPATDLGNGEIFPETVLNLGPMLLGRNSDGRASWLERMLSLRDEFGVFRLAYLEAIVRAADVQASADPQDYFEKGASEDE